MRRWWPVVMLVTSLGCGPFPTKPGDACGTFGLNGNVTCPAGLTCVDDAACAQGHESCARVCVRSCTADAQCTTMAPGCVCGGGFCRQNDASGNWVGC